MMKNIRLLERLVLIPFTEKVVDATVIEGFEFEQVQREIEKVTRELFPGFLGLGDELFSNPNLLQEEEFEPIGTS